MRAGEKNERKREGERGRGREGGLERRMRGSEKGERGRGRE